MAIQEMLDINKDNIEKICLVDNAKDWADNAINAVRFYLRKHKGDDESVSRETD
jgi:hypothetical protein